MNGKSQSIKSTKAFAPIILLITILSFYSCNQSKQAPSNNESLSEAAKRKKENALVGFEIYQGLEAQVFAAEPMVVNPTNMDIDAKGRVWVCEGINYRPKLNIGNDSVPEGDKIVILEDTDGDGKADESKTFYQGKDINVALGIAVFGNKVIVSASPNMLIFTDEDVPGGATAYMMQKVLEEQDAYQWLDSKPICLPAKEHRPAYGSDGDYFSKPNIEDVVDKVYEIMHETDPQKFPTYL